MKLNLLILLALLGAPIAFAEDKHDHEKESKEEHAEHGDHDDHGGHGEEDAKKGPNGGHVVTSKSGFSLELFVGKDKKPRIAFLDKDLKAVKLEAQSVSATAGERSAPVKIAFAKGKDADSEVLVGDKELPSGAHVPMVLVIKTTADAKAVTERFELHMH